MIFKDQAQLCFTFDQDDYSAQITKSPNSSGNIFIPRYIKHESHEYKIKKILKCAFKSNYKICSISFPDDSELDEIENEAFSDCYNLKFITIPDNVTKIGDNAFSNCMNLFNVNISNNSKLASIGKFAFSDDRYLTLKFIPDHVKYIGESAFNRCHFIDIMISENSELVSYENNVFAKTYITTLFIPEKMTHLKDYWCNSLKCLINVKVSPKNKHFKLIDANLLVGKTEEESDDYDVLYFVNRQIESFTIPSNIKYIKPNAFQKCKKLIKIEILPDSKLRTFSKDCFSYTLITSLFIPSQVTKLEDGWCKTSCRELNVSISPENKFFRSIDDDKLIVGKSNNENDDYDSLYLVNSNACEISIPSYIKYIKPYAFLHCSHLDKIEFQSDSQLTTVEAFGFAYSNSYAIVLPKSVQNLCENAFHGSDIGKIEFQEGSKIKSIEKSAFEKSHIYSIDIPASVNEIKEKAFYECEDLKNLNFSEDSELISIGSSAISGSKIKTFFIPPKLEEMCDEMSLFSKNLENIIISPKNEIFKLTNDALFVGKSSKDSKYYDTLYLSLSKSKTLKIPSEIKVIKPQALNYSADIEAVEIQPDSQLTMFGKMIFNYSTSIKHIFIPKHVKSICENAFINIKIETIEFAKDSELELIDSFAFYNNRTIKSICFPSSLKYIKDNAFRFCDLLEKIEFPEDSQLISIGEEAFRRTVIKEVIFPKHLQVIERHAFYDCYSLQSVTFPNDSELIEIKEYAFDETGINKITIPDSVKNIGIGAFFNNYNLSEFNIQENSELVSLDHIFDKSSVESLFIPPKLSELSTNLFSQNLSINKISVSPKNPYFKFIENKILVGKFNKESDDFDTIYLVVQNEEEIKIPSNIKCIKSYAFIMSQNIKKIEFPTDSQLTTIDRHAFHHLPIEHIVIPKHVQYIFESPFSKCNNLQTIEFSECSEFILIDVHVFDKLPIVSISIPPQLKVIQKEMFNNCKNLKYINIPENSELVSIEPEAFGMSLIESIFIPEKVEYLKDGWCSGAMSLSNIIVSPKNKNFKFIDKSLLLGKSDKESDDFDSVLFVSRDIIDVEVPSYIKYIKSNSFSSNKLQSVRFHPNSQFASIEEETFFSAMIEKITIPKSVKKIGRRAFYSCPNLSLVEFEANSQLSLIDEEAFYSSGIRKILFPKSLKKINNLAFSHCAQLQDISFPPDSELETIEFKAFSKTGLSSRVHLPKSVKEISNFAFYKCRRIQTVVFDKNSEVEIFRFGSFAKTGLEKFIVPSSVKTIEQAAFADCDKLKKFYFEDNSKLSSIGYAAFNNTGITAMIIPSSVEQFESDIFVGTYAFIEFLGDVIDLTNQGFHLQDNRMVLSFPNAKNVYFSDYISGNLIVFIVSSATINY